MVSAVVDACCGGGCDVPGIFPNPTEAVFLPTYAALRAMTGSTVRHVFITGQYGTAMPNLCMGWFTRDDADVTSADDGGTIIVGTVTTIRWKRVKEERYYNAHWFCEDGLFNRVNAQKAIDAVPDTGGVLHIPRAQNAGSKWDLGTGYLDFTGKDDFFCYGDGMGGTVFDGSAHIAAAYPFDAILNCGNNVAPNVSNQRFKGFSLICNSADGSTKTNHAIGYRRFDNIEFDSIEISFCGREVLYCDGASTSIGIKVHDCWFHDNFAQLCACINTNTGINVHTIEIVNNRFETSTNGMYILGKNIRVIGNSFRNMIEACGNFAESNFNNQESIDSCVVANNTCEGLGTQYPAGPWNPVNIQGFTSNARSFAYANSGADNGIIFANNSFKDCAAPAATTTKILRATAGALVIGNYASGKIGAGLVYFLNAMFSSDVNSFVGVNGTPTKLSFHNNVLERKPAGNNIDNGIVVLSVDNAHLDMSGNRLHAAVGGQGATWESAPNGFLPEVTVNGDIIQPTFRLYDLAGTDCCPSTVDQVPIYGSNRTTFRTFGDPDLLSSAAARNLGGSATPSVAKGSWFYCINAAPQNITDFINAPSYVREITIWFNDANTTIVHNAALIRLRGAVNYVSAVGSSITLCRPNHINTAWVEKCRQ